VLSAGSFLPPRPLVLAPPRLFYAGYCVGIVYSGFLPSLAIWNCLKISSLAGSGFLAAGALAVAALPSFLFSSFLAFSKVLSALAFPLAETGACTLFSFGLLDLGCAFSISTFGTLSSFSTGLASATLGGTY